MGAVTPTAAVRPSSAYVRSALGLLVKEAIWYLTLRHEPGTRPDICVFASYRGGSTWLMELIAAEKGMRPLNEPLGPWSGAIAQARHMPKYRAGQIVHFDSDKEEAQLTRYVELLLSGRAAVNAPWWFWRRNYPFRSDRLVVKITEAKCLIDWFDATFDVQIVLLARHPIPRALSCIHNKWESNAAAFLANQWFCDEYLGPEHVRYCQDIVDNGTELQKQVLSWALENLVPLRLFPDRPHWVFVSYEACVLRPDDTLLALSEQLDLSDAGAMRERLRTPSRSSHMSQAATRDQITHGDSSAILGRWRNEVPEDEERELLDILGTLGIPLYRPGVDLPQPWW